MIACPPFFLIPLIAIVPPITFSLISSLMESSREDHPLLVSFLNICQQQSVSDFLFTSTPVQVSPLSSTQLPRTAFLCELSTIRLHLPTLHPNPNTRAPNPDDSFRLDSRLFFVPAYTTGSLIVGVGVAQALDNLPLPIIWDPLSPSHPMTFHLRFAFDSSTQTNLCVVHIPEQDLFLLYHARHSSPTFCVALTARVRRSALLNVIAANPASLTLDDILPAFHIIITDSLYRPCPICNSLPSFGCSCVLAPLPLQNFRQAMQQTHGSFEGISSRLPISAPGISTPPAPRAALGVSYRYKQQPLDRLMHILRCWALNDAAPCDPCESIWLSSYGDYGNEVHAAGADAVLVSCGMYTTAAGEAEPGVDTALSELLA